MTTLPAYFRPEWSPFTVLAMVLGFIVFWPLGLAVLAYVLWGERFGWTGERAERWVNKQKAWGGWCQPNQNHRASTGRGFGFSQSGPATGNAAFDAYRDEQLKRLDEERRKLDQEIEEFHDYLKNLRMARDREEFDRFMRDRQNRQPPANPDDNQTGNATSF